MPLFPDAENITGKRDIIKVDSDPGRMELGFLAEALGFIIYPGVPNTAAVTRDRPELWSIQDTISKKLKKLSDSRLLATTLLVCHHGWLAWHCHVWRDRSHLRHCCFMQCIWHQFLQRTKSCYVGKVWYYPVDPRIPTKQFPRPVIDWQWPGYIKHSND